VARFTSTVTLCFSASKDLGLVRKWDGLILFNEANLGLPTQDLEMPVWYSSCSFTETLELAGYVLNGSRWLWLCFENNLPWLGHREGLSQGL